MELVGWAIDARDGAGWGGAGRLHGLGSHVFDILRGYFDQYGYWTLFFALLLENAGFPLPGETILLFASFLAFSQQQLQLPWIIVTGVVAATLGDNLGYSLGWRGGRVLHDRLFGVRRRTVRKAFERGEELFRRHGDLTIFFARFVFGMRIIAGPLAGILRMPWGKFVLFNFLGAVTWVTAVAVAGYQFGEHWEELIKMVGRVNLGITVVAAYVAFWIWRRYRAKRRNVEAMEKRAEEEMRPRG